MKGKRVVLGEKIIPAKNIFFYFHYNLDVNTYRQNILSAFNILYGQ